MNPSFFLFEIGTFEPSDITFDVPSEVHDIDPGDLRFCITCPGYETPRTMAHTLLGRRVRCSKCQSAFRASWGLPAERGS